ncbi:MAG: RNA polymerase sigma factor [Gemmataceae bacterium]
MAESSFGTVQLQGWLERLRAGDRAAPDELIRHVCGRLERLTRTMLRDFPGVRRWAETDDVLQSALLRLLRALREARPSGTREFFALAAAQIRRELLDLARHYFGPLGDGAHHASVADVGSGPPLYERADDSQDPSRLAEWCEFHRHIASLPEPEREVVDLIFYHGLTQAEAAEVLGVTVRTVQRRWQSALLRLHPILKGGWPG